MGLEVSQLSFLKQGTGLEIQPGIVDVAGGDVDAFAQGAEPMVAIIRALPRLFL